MSVHYAVYNQVLIKSPLRMDTHSAYISQINTKFDDEAIAISARFINFICTNNQVVQEARKFCLILIPKTKENIENIFLWYHNHDLGFRITFDLSSIQTTQAKNYSWNKYIGESIRAAKDIPSRPLDESKSIFKK